MSLKLGGGVALVFAFGVDLTVCSVCICLGLAIGGIVFFGLTIDGIDFWRLIGDSIDFWYCFPFLLLSSELMDLEDKRSSSFDSWTPLNVGFPLKSGSVECVFANVSL